MATELEKRGKQEVSSTAAERVEQAGAAYIPDIDIYASDEGVLFAVDMPGVEKGKVNIEVTEDDTLVIRGTCAQCEPERRPLVQQYNVGDYYRAFQIGKDYNKDKVEAALENGLLVVRIPKREEAKPRRIQVTA
jgi:HSP20 family protein